MVYNKEEIERLLIERAAGSISEGDIELLEEAISADIEVRQLSEEVAERFRSPRAERFLQNLDEEQAWQKVKRQVEEPVPVREIRSFRSNPWISVAAAILVIVSFGLYFYLSPDKPAAPAAASPHGKSVQLLLGNGKVLDLSGKKSQKINIGQTQLNTSAEELSLTTGSDRVEWSTLNVPSGFDYKITLADGTRVWLNSASSLRFPFAFSDKKREVYLQGEAYFEVEKNPAKPFIVHTANTDIQVLGTSFNVNAYDKASPTTSLVEGKVLASASGHESMVLEPGYQAVFNGVKGFEKERFDEGLVLSWREGVYHFHDTKLVDIARVISNWYGYPVVIDNSQRANENFTGLINKKKPVKVFLENLNLSSGVEASFKNDTLHLK